MTHIPVCMCVHTFVDTNFSYNVCMCVHERAHVLGNTS